MNLPVAYLVLKLTTIILGGLYAPLGVYIGYCLGTKKIKRALIALCVQVGLSLLDGGIYWYLLETLTG